MQIQGKMSNDGYVMWTPEEMDALRAVLAEKDARIAELETRCKDLIDLNRRNVDDATRIIGANQDGLNLAYVSLVEWGKREQGFKALEADNQRLRAELAEAKGDAEYWHKMYLGDNAPMGQQGSEG